MKCFFTLFIIFLLSISSAFSQTFRFTAIPDENTERLQKRFNKVAKYLSEQLNVNVKYVPVKSYSASVAAFKNDQVQLAWFGGLSGVKARRSVPGSVAIAQGEEDLQFVTYFIAHASTGVKLSKEFPAEIKGHTFTFGSKGSTSGRLMPEFFIRQHFKKEPNKIFKRVGFSGDHSKTIALVQSGGYEIGALNFKVWENELKAGNIDTNKVRVIWKTPTYPDYNWTIRGDVGRKFGEDFIQKVKDALINLSDREVLDSFPRQRFIEADNSTYGAILETAIIIGIIES
ncbi:putative selenate ABC transporter substrate-binding protein [candidate division KSB1 bacterium]|nr:putative selenate ABC transporter substrate-binding protein [candidate division KSB1 bacterium]MCH8020256.1 putative selenate ABC transporter substrate-binding protein [candidate division KSB1 bacterium]